MDKEKRLTELKTRHIRIAYLKELYESQKSCVIREFLIREASKLKYDIVNNELGYYEEKPFDQQHGSY